MLTRTLCAAILAAFVSVPASASEFTYRGHLTDGDRPATGHYDLQVTVFSDAHGGAPLGEPTVLWNVTVTGGNFSVPVTIDDASASGGKRWLQLAVRESGSRGAFDPLPAREVLAPDATCTGAWDLSGNSGIPMGSFVGTTDNSVLELRSNNSAMASFDGFAQTVSIGSPDNQVAQAGSVALGGISGQGNTASGFASLAGGGVLNIASGFESTALGGQDNTAPGLGSVALGGAVNTAGGDRSFAMGYYARVRTQAQTMEPGTCSNDSTCGDEGTFVWADSSAASDFLSTGPNQFLIRAVGGVGINTNAPTAGGLSVNGKISVATLGTAGATSLCLNASNEISSCSSSERYKDHITNADYGLDTVAALRPVRYEWKATHAPDIGLVAEEVAKVDPDLVTHNAKGQIEGVKYDRLAAVLVKAVQQQQGEIATLRARNADLQAQDARTREQLDSLRSAQQRLTRQVQQLVAASGLAADASVAQADGRTRAAGTPTGAVQ